MSRHKLQIIDALKKDISFKEAEIQTLGHFGLVVTLNSTTDPKFLILESSKVYQSIEEQSRLLEIISSSGCTAENSYRIPFFSGLSGADLGNFLLGPGKVIEGISLDVGFDVLPVDFNYYGIKRFLNYLNIIRNQPPVFGGNNRFEMYEEYFVDLMVKNDFKINMILPTVFMEIFPNGSILEELFEEVKTRQMAINIASK